MGVHPEYRPIVSNCGNCAAFCGDYDPELNIAFGECRRFAPRASHGTHRILSDGKQGDSVDVGQVAWPLIDHEVPFCLDWHPLNHPGTITPDESMWGKFVESLTVRARNGLDREAITSFAQLSSMCEHDLLRITGFGLTTVQDIRTKLAAITRGDS